MRSVIIDYIRERDADKRGGGQLCVTLGSDVEDVAGNQTIMIALHQGLERLQKIEPRLAEVVELRYFAGLSIDEVARHLGMSDATVKRDWEKARAFLYLALAEK
jgi:RNA polymerase sigma factor (TIGR02999 family)